MVSPDSIPRYEQPVYEEEPDWDEIVTCANCGHCNPVTDAECKQVVARMTPYGKWHEHEREVILAIRHALKCFGSCPVRGGLVDLADVPCDHFWEGE